MIRFSAIRHGAVLLVTRLRALSRRLLVLVALLPAAGFATVIDFEGLPDSTSLTTQISGVVFTHATVITAGITLNEFEFPPHSGDNVAFDDGGPLTIAFAIPQAFVGAFFTYGQALTLEVFDSANVLLEVVHSAFSNNEALSGEAGSAPDEFLSFTHPGIGSVAIIGNPSGTSFTIDDLTLFQTVPEPTTLALLVPVLFCLWLASSRRIRELGGRSLPRRHDR